MTQNFEDASALKIATVWKNGKEKETQRELQNILYSMGKGQEDIKPLKMHCLKWMKLIKINSMFTQKCFIRKNTPELVKKLEELGYKALFSARNGHGVHLYCINGNVLGVDSWVDKGDDFIDCKESEELFIAIASLRDDTDKNQWFIHDDSAWNDKPNIFWYKCEEDSIIEDLAYNLMFNDCKKATVQELIEHFKP